MKKLTYLACVGDVNNPLTFSGIAYHMLQAGKRGGLFYAGLPLDTELLSWKTRRLAWNGLQVLKGKGTGGFQYSASFMEKLWQPYVPSLRNQVVINLFQLFPQSVIDDELITKWACIDMTLKQLFEEYGVRENIGKGMDEQAIAQERKGYEACEGIIAFCNWAKESLVKDYGIHPKKIHVIVPGANIDVDLYEQWEREQRIERVERDRQSAKPLKLVFVGKYWHRKGLDRLLDAIAIGCSQGLKVHVKVLGCDKASVPVPYQNFPEVEYVDFIDKRTDGLRFLKTVSDADLGVLLSRAEAGGMALREYHSLGLAVLGPDVGGAKEHMLPGAGIAVTPEATTQEIAEILLSLQNDTNRLSLLKQKSWEQHREATWMSFTEKLGTIWPYTLDAPSKNKGVATEPASTLNFLACVGDVNDQVTFSGIPYHFLQAGQRANVIHAGLPMSANSPAWLGRRLWWNLKRTATGKSFGGYQYSPAFLEALWEPYREQLRGNIVINLFQIFPPSILNDPKITKWHCVDMTLKQLFYEYNVVKNLGYGIAERAMAYEKEAYQACEGVIALCSWAKDSIVADYGIEPEKVHVIIPGANIDSDLYESWEKESATHRTSRSPEDPLRLVFVGKYWYRKGLDRLLRAVQIGRKSGLKAEVHVLGCSSMWLPSQLRQVSGVYWHGLVNKKKEGQKFLNLVANADIGCLLSRAEAVGMALREYHALGLATIGPDVGGAREHVDPKSSWLFSVNASDEEIAEHLLMLQRKPDMLQAAKEHAWQTRHEATWQHFIQQFSQLGRFLPP